MFVCSRRAPGRLGLAVQPVPAVSGIAVQLGCPETLSGWRPTTSCPDLRASADWQMGHSLCCFPLESGWSGLSRCRRRPSPHVAESVGNLCLFPPSPPHQAHRPSSLSHPRFPQPAPDLRRSPLAFACSGWQVSTPCCHCWLSLCSGPVSRLLVRPASPTTSCVPQQTTAHIPNTIAWTSPRSLSAGQTSVAAASCPADVVGAASPCPATFIGATCMLTCLPGFHGSPGNITCTTSGWDGPTACSGWFRAAIVIFRPD